MKPNGRMAGRFRRDQAGSTLVEYGLVATLVATIAIAMLRSLGTL